MSKYCVGVDLGGTFIKFILLDSAMGAGQVMQLPTPASGGGSAVADRIAEGVRKIIAQRGLTNGDVAGVGIGSPGPLKISEGIVIATPNVAGMENVPLRDMVSAATGLPAILENDANAAGYGEFIAGAGRGSSDMVLLTLGTGVGGGVIIDGKVLHGSHEMGAELGHIIVQPGGEKCGCGQYGCLERYSAAAAIARYAGELIRGGRQSSMKKILDANGALDSKDVHAALVAGDAVAAEVWDRGAYYLGLACVSLCRIFDPAEIVLSGGLAKAGEDLRRPVETYLHKFHWPITEVKTALTIATLGNDAGAIGAAGLAWQAMGNR
ncbi:MAG: ROK family protein [Planctomycetaceae bacterium]|nr:ROK family protein [Planctomycetaceae bacterium]